VGKSKLPATVGPISSEFLDSLKPLDERWRLMLSHLFATGWSWDAARKEVEPAHSHLRADLP